MQENRRGRLLPGATNPDRAAFVAVDGSEVRVTSRKRRERATTNLRIRDLERVRSMDVRDAKVHVTKRGDIRMIEYVDESRRTK